MPKAENRYDKIVDFAKKKEIKLRIVAPVDNDQIEKLVNDQHSYVEFLKVENDVELVNQIKNCKAVVFFNKNEMVYWSTTYALAHRDARSVILIDKDVKQILPSYKGNITFGHIVDIIEENA